MGTNSSQGSELLIELRRESGQPLWVQLEDALRESIRSGRLAPSAKLPPTRVLAADLGVSRRLVVDAYAQLLAERYLVARRGAGTYVAEVSAATSASPDEAPATSPLGYDFFPGHPDLAGFPWRPWLRAMRETITAAPHRRLGYDDVRGAAELRQALAEHLRRVRGVVADPQRIVVCSGAAQGLVLLARALGAPHVAMEDPGWPQLRGMLSAHGARLSALPVDSDGARIAELTSIERACGRPSAVFVTPAHQSPTGVALAPERRAALLEWASRGGLVIEDDYDAELRYGRPAGCLQGLAPDVVVLAGTVSKTLAPALRLGWLCLPGELVAEAITARAMADGGGPRFEELALAELIASGAFDRHLRAARQRYREKRALLLDTLESMLPGVQLRGVAAGLHVLLELPAGVGEKAVIEGAVEAGVKVEGLTAYTRAHSQPPGLVLGYGLPSERELRQAAAVIAEAITALLPKSS